MLQTLALKNYPELKRIILTAFPSYKKHNCFVSVFSGKQRINSYWDGGSKSEYSLVHLETMKRLSLPTSTHPFFDIAGQGLANQQDANIETDSIGNLYLKTIPENVVLVEGGTFCGRTATVHIRFHQNNFPKQLTA